MSGWCGNNKLNYFTENQAHEEEPGFCRHLLYYNIVILPAFAIQNCSDLYFYMYLLHQISVNGNQFVVCFPAIRC